ncbi:MULTISPECIES: 16S rRNA (cytosine(1402)-N(4))-methyltransferase RsmH [unclassified Novosphingobium]|uniref:16S rRNA (cytosine(1402)-N(4))-methyltransferase RsmH n=1 Tax=unclassified Novosphingobium TaxID=2644732 RepID=UPI000D4C8A39|nr:MULTISPECIES: 16S rRNA (cytosine(1402)-N(4))-methyltransferase RsmH [unclassified Novosphingobium]PTR12270.1 16S rRNA (cytosine1402-N4)-methyltransferase [Novosphingobium sp. GV055]PUB05671.1 16S rRNA (cytosine1402-N4)-methyltransferase [Novosphingobium sp. GV061]PUB21904.1 16S rRNA (cytosine1402-N4)-methyltransferase [Novosphingobium sp. GV079]PUB43677.1 16S rRNA (cytosine1402-N4)-methyltransferase [Novosphingobium sp. GV027]
MSAQLPTDLPPSAAVPAQAPHIPVLLDEVIAALAPQPGEVIVDGTFGAGGYTRAILAQGATVHAFDRDPDAIAAGRLWPETQGDAPTLVLHPRRFSEMATALAEAGVGQVQGVVLDIGVSSMQLDQRERGFAFSSDGPLDMRMSQDGMSAADFLNEADEAEIADVLYIYGEERQSRRVARAVVAARPLTTTGQFAAVVRKALGYRPGAAKDPATRSFQAVRIHVNGELDELRAALDAAERLLAPGGRLAVVSFHSLEDRIVKQFLREAAGATPAGSRHLPPQAQAFAAVFEKPSAAIRPGPEEEARNPRARSATLRWAVRTAAPARALAGNLSA